MAWLRPGTTHSWDVWSVRRRRRRRNSGVGWEHAAAAAAAAEGWTCSSCVQRETLLSVVTDSLEHSAPAGGLEALGEVRERRRWSRLVKCKNARDTLAKQTDVPRKGAISEPCQSILIQTRQRSYPTPSPLPPQLFPVFSGTPSVCWLQQTYWIFQSEHAHSSSRLYVLLNSWWRDSFGGDGVRWLQ